MLILSEATPNPDALKFLPHRRLTDGVGWDFVRGEVQPAASPIADALLALPDVHRVHVGEDFVTVTRRASGRPWSTMKILVIAAIADALFDDPPVLASGGAPPAPIDPIEHEIRQVLGTYVQPGVARDGGSVVFHSFDPGSGLLVVRMEGACGGCPSSRRTLKDGLEVIVRRYVPEVRRVEEFQPEPPPPAEPAWRRWKAGELVGAPVRTLFTHMGRVLRD